MRSHYVRAVCVTSTQHTAQQSVTHTLSSAGKEDVIKLSQLDSLLEKLKREKLDVQSKDGLIKLSDLLTAYWECSLEDTMKAQQRRAKRLRKAGVQSL